jgi:hypothetical protein
MGAESSPKIVIVDESPIRAAILEEGLWEAGFTGVVHISEMQSLLARSSARVPPMRRSALSGNSKKRGGSNRTCIETVPIGFKSERIKFSRESAVENF